MEKIIRISDIGRYVDQVVTVRGWLYNHRSSGKIRFLEMRDGSVGTLQCVVAQGTCDDETFRITGELTQESSLAVTGKAKAHPKRPGVFELDVHHATLVNKAEANYPISHKEHGVEFLMEQRHLWLRTPRQVAVMRVRASIIKSIRDFFDSRGFVLMDAPILTPAACEGTSTLFETEYFEQKAYLTQSGQLYGEVGAMALGKTYVFGPTFRAEKSKTRKHLTEFWMVEPEVAFWTIDENMDLGEALVTTVMKDVLARNGAELAVLQRDTARLEEIALGGFPRVSYDECIRMLNENGHPFPWGEDFGAPEETKIGDLFGGKPVFIHRFPKQIKSFYFKPDPQNPKVALGCDLIAPEGYGEVIGGGMREEDYETLRKAVIEHKLPIEDYQWYLDLRRYGSVPHGGFGLGLERTVSWVCGLDHVRETIAFPRMLNYLRP
ncbi:MAG: asparagine--tRNA ligase [Bdellovibrionales bacterium]|nr:asparagine--tRNA ligase [Bdellovibrionales bacterium]